MSYVNTIIVLAFMKSSGQISVIELLSKQIFFGLAVGVCCFYSSSICFFNRVKISIEGLYPIFTIGIVLTGYALSELLSGNGLLCVYVIGIIMGNTTLIHTKTWCISLMECLGLCRLFCSLL